MDTILCKAQLIYYYHSLVLTTSLTFKLQWRSFTRYFTISPLPPHAAAITGVHPYFRIQKRRGNSRVLALVEVCLWCFKISFMCFSLQKLYWIIAWQVHTIQSLYNVWLLRKVATLRSLWLLHNVHPVNFTSQPLKEQIIAVISEPCFACLGVD